MLRRALPILCLAAALAACEAPRPELRVAVPHLPPHFVADDAGGEYLARIHHTLRLQGLEMAPVFVRFGQLEDALRAGAVDAAAPIPDDGGPGIAVTGEAFVYRNVLATLTTGPRVDTPADLAGRRVVAFVGADRVLGPAFARAAAGNPDYLELNDQYEQALLLYLGRVDVAVADEAILRHHLATISRRFGETRDLRVARPFPPTPLRIGFREPHLARAYERASQHGEETGP